MECLTNLPRCRITNVRADALDRFELVRAEEHDLAAAGQLLDQTGRQERKTHVESGVSAAPNMQFLTIAAAESATKRSEPSGQRTASVIAEFDAI
jgi:hypothetical protein